MIKDGSTILLRIDTINGNMEIKGELYHHQDSLSTNASDAFVIKDDSDDPVLILENGVQNPGDLRIAGGLFEQSNP